MIGNFFSSKTHAFASMVVLLCLCVLQVRPVSAQPILLPGNPVASTLPQLSSQTILQTLSDKNREARMEIVYVRGDDGKYVPVIGLTVTQIEALLKLMYDQNPEPLYSIQSLSAEGQVVDNTANLTIHLQIQTQNEPLIRVPIGLKSGIFDEQDKWQRIFQYEGPAMFADIIASPQGEGYEIILRNEPSQTQNVPTVSTSDMPANDTPIGSTPVSDVPTEIVPESDVPQQPQEEPVPTPELEPVTEPITEEALVPVSESAPTSILADETETAEQITMTLVPETHQLIHTITLRMTFPVVQLSVNEYQLKAEFPSARSSYLQLVVPLADAVVLQSKGGSLRQNVKFDERSTLLEFRRIQDDFEVQWHEKQHTMVRERVVLQVENGNIIARLTPTSVVFDATIPVQSTGGTFDSFYLQLPRGAVFLPSQPSEVTEYQIEEQSQEQSETSDEPVPLAQQSQMLLFRLPRPTEGPVHVRVRAETPIDHSQNGLFELGGFNVSGAEKQFGNLSVIVPRETRLSQKINRGIRPSTQVVVPETEGVVTSFEYYEQPCSFLVQAVPQAARVYLRPEYQVQIINRNHAVLRAKLTYTISGGQNQLAINMNGWQLTDVGPDNLVNRDELPFMESGNVIIPLLEPVGKRIELNLRAERVFDSADGEIRFCFPDSEADGVEPALAAIIPADNIELKIDANNPPVEMTLKSRRNTPLEIEIPDRQQGAMVYQIDHPGRAEFRAKPTLQPQKIRVQSQTELSLPDSQVVQTLNYTVDYESVLRLTLALPIELIDQDDLKVTYESRQLTLFDLSDPPDHDTIPEGVVLKQVLLPDAKIGSFQLTVNFKLKSQSNSDLGGMLPRTTTQVAVPIILPNDGNLLHETVNIRYPREIRLNHDEETTNWVKLESPSSTVGSSSRLTNTYRTEKPTNILSLGASLKNAELLGTATVEKGWVRCWLQGSGRTDCACYQITTRLSHFTVTLPENIRSDKVVIKVDNHPVEFERKGNVLRIPLTSSPNVVSGSTSATSRPSSVLFDTPENDRPRTVEIWYEVSMYASSNKFSLEMPKFSVDTIVRPVYCQVILPSSRHLLAYRQNWMPQFQWRFVEGSFSRKPELSQSELENWVGIAPGDPISPSWNSYLFLSFHPEVNVEIDVADRSTLVLVSSGLVLLLGLVFIYFPRTRYPGVVFTSMVLFVSFFAYRITLTIIFLQAGVVGFLLVLMASFLYRLFISANTWKHLPVRPLPGSATAGLSPAYPVEEDRSNLARVRVARSESAVADSSSSDGGTQLYPRPNGDRKFRENDNVSPNAPSDIIDNPTDENDRGDHA